MINQLKQLSKDTLIYGLGNALQGAIGFFLLPIYTRFLTPSDYGQLELLNVTSSVLVIFTIQGLSTAFFRFYSYTKDTQTQRELIHTSFYYLFCSALLSCSALFLFSPQYTNLIYKPSESFEFYLKILCCTIFFEIGSLIPFQLYRVKLQSIRYVTVKISGLMLNVGLNIYFVVGLKWSVKGVLLGNMISAFSILTANMLQNRSLFQGSFSVPKLKELLRFGFPLIFAALFTWILEISDRILLQKLASTEDVGLYALGQRFSSILAMAVIGPFSTAWGGYCFQIATKENAKQTFGLITTYWALLLCFAGTGLIALTPLVLKVMTTQPFWQAQNVVFPLVCTGIVSGMYTIFDLGINIAKKTKYMAYIVGVGAIMNVVLNVLWIPKFGMEGSAFASLSSFFAIMSITCYISQNLYPIPFEKGRLFRIFLVFLLLAAITQILDFDSLYLDLLVRILIVLAFWPILLLTGFLNANERLFIRSFYQRLIQRVGA